MVERQKKIRWGIAILSMFFIGLLVDYFFLHYLFRLKEPSRYEEVLPEETSPPVPSTTPASTPVALAFQDSPTSVAPAEFKKQVEKCLGPKFARNNNPDALLRELENTHPITRSQLQMENTHLELLSDGSERRLHLIANDNSNAKENLELRYFKLDDEGLPLRIELKPEETFNPKPEFIESLKRQGSITFLQRKEVKSFEDGSELLLTTVNGQVYEFQYFSNGKTFSCREWNCACR